MKISRISSTTIQILPTAYFRTNPVTVGFGWLGRSVEFGFTPAAQAAPTGDVGVATYVKRTVRPLRQQFSNNADYYEALLEYEDIVGPQVAYADDIQRWENSQASVNRLFSLFVNSGR